ncbi:hypothetical protein, partial [Methylobacterium oryzisoli]
APVLVDLRNVYRADDVRKHGFAYTSIGQPCCRAGRPGRSPARSQDLCQFNRFLQGGEHHGLRAVEVAEA